MGVWEGVAVYLGIGVICVPAYAARVLLVGRKPITLRAFLWGATKVVFLWPLPFLYAA